MKNGNGVVSCKFGPKRQGGGKSFAMEGGRCGAAYHGLTRPKGDISKTHEPSLRDMTDHKGKAG